MIKFLLILSMLVLFSCTSNIPFLDSEPLTVIHGELQNDSGDTSFNLSDFSVYLSDLVTGERINDFSCGSTDDDGKFICHNRSTVKRAYNDVIVYLLKSENGERIMFQRYLRQLNDSIIIDANETFISQTMFYLQDSYTAGILGYAESIDLSQKEELGFLLDKQYLQLKEIVSGNSQLEPQIRSSVSSSFLTPPAFSYDQLDSAGLINDDLVSINAQLRVSFHALAASATFFSNIYTLFVGENYNCNDRFRELPVLNTLNSETTIFISNCITFSLYDGVENNADFIINSDDSHHRLDLIESNIVQYDVGTHFSLLYNNNVQFDDTRYLNTIALSRNEEEQYLKVSTFNDNVNHLFTWLKSQYDTFPEASSLSLEEFELDNVNIEGVKLRYNSDVYSFLNYTFNDNVSSSVDVKSVSAMYLPIDEKTSLENYYLVDFGQPSYANPHYNKLLYNTNDLPEIPVSTILKLFSKLTDEPFYLDYENRLYTLFFRKNGRLDYFYNGQLHTGFTWSLAKSQDGYVRLTILFDTNFNVNQGQELYFDIAFNSDLNHDKLTFYSRNSSVEVSIRQTKFAYQRFEPSFDTQFYNLVTTQGDVAGYDYLKHERVTFQGKENVLKQSRISFSEFRVEKEVSYFWFSDVGVFFFDSFESRWLLMIGYPLDEGLLNNISGINTIEFRNTFQLNNKYFNNLIELSLDNSMIFLDQAFRFVVNTETDDGVVTHKYEDVIDNNDFAHYWFSENVISDLAFCNNCSKQYSSLTNQVSTFIKSSFKDPITGYFVNQTLKQEDGNIERYYLDENKQLVQMQTITDEYILTRFVNSEGSVYKSEKRFQNGRIEIQENGEIYTKSKVIYDPLKRTYVTSPYQEGNDYIHIYNDHFEYFSQTGSVEGFIGEYFQIQNDYYRVPLRLSDQQSVYFDSVSNTQYSVTKTGSLSVTDSDFLTFKLSSLIVNVGQENQLQYAFSYNVDQYTGYYLYDANGDTVETSEIVSISWANEETFIRALLNNPSLPIFNTDFKHIESLDLTGSYVQNIDFLRYFVDLKQLNLTTLSTLSNEIALLSLSNLERVIFDDDYEFINWSQAMLYDFSNLPRLQYVKASGYEFIDGNIENGAFQSPPFSKKPGSNTATFDQ